MARLSDGGANQDLKKQILKRLQTAKKDNTRLRAFVVSLKK